MAGFGSNGGSSEYMKLFADYDKENEKISIWLKRFEGVFREIEKLEKDVKAKNVLGKKADDKDKEVFESLRRDLDEMKRVVTALLENMARESPEISSFLGSISHDEISTSKFAFDRIRNYNKDKYKLIRQFSQLMPSFAKDLKGVVEIPMVALEDSAKSFNKFCIELIKVIKAVPSRGAMFESLGILLNYLMRYVGNVRTLTQNDKEAFLNALGSLDKSNNSKKIVGNLLDSLGSAHSIYDEFSNLLSDVGINLASLKGDGSTYASLTSDKQGRVDKFTHKTLKVLFSNVTGRKAGKSILDIINKQIFEEDLSDVQKEFNDLYVSLVNSKFKSLTYNNNNSYENLYFTCDGLNEYLDFKSFMAEKFKNRSKTVVVSANLYLSNLIGAKDKGDEPYKSFIKYNEDKGILAKSSSSSSSGSVSKDVEKDFKKMKRLLASIITFLGEGKGDDFFKDVRNGLNVTESEAESTASNIRFLFSLLFMGKKQSIVEKKGVYSCENFTKILDYDLKDNYDKIKVSEFLKLCYENFDKFNGGGLEPKLLSEFLKRFDAVCPLTYLFM